MIKMEVGARKSANSKGTDIKLSVAKGSAEEVGKTNANKGGNRKVVTAVKRTG